MARADTPPLNFVPIVPQRAFEDIAGQIQELVAKGKLKPGDRLPPERELSVRFNVSRNTLREALRALELSGVIEMRKGASGGAFIMPGNPDVIVNGLSNLYHLGSITPADLTEARIWIESLVVRIACERATDADIQALEDNVNEAVRAEKAGDIERRVILHRRFHTLLGEITGNPIVRIIMESVMEVLGQFIKVLGPTQNMGTVASRRRLLKHLRTRDADKAVAEMTGFLTKLHAKYLELWSRKRSEAA
jgi:GntR family transcriptional repressor for pyruvate dehydrogenase complex